MPEYPLIRVEPHFAVNIDGHAKKKWEAIAAHGSRRNADREKIAEEKKGFEDRYGLYSTDTGRFYRLSSRLRKKGSAWEVYTDSGTKPTGLDAVEWARKAEGLGAGEILLTSMDCDGTKNGYDIELTRAVAEAVNTPVIASGGAGNLQHLHVVLSEGKADAVLAASIFHYGEYTINEAKVYLKEKGISVRP